MVLRQRQKSPPPESQDRTAGYCWGTPVKRGDDGGTDDAIRQARVARRYASALESIGKDHLARIDAIAEAHHREFDDR